MSEEEQDDTKMIIIVTLVSVIVAGLLGATFYTRQGSVSYSTGVRVVSAEKAVLNNLRQIASAADQYFIEEGMTEAYWDDLIGTDRYVKSIYSVHGEDYSLLFPIDAGFSQLEVYTPSGEVITYRQ